MTETIHAPSYRRYWSTWGVLLSLTLAMLALTGSLVLPKLALVGLLLMAMLAKATLIGSEFMHLRFEKLALILMVVIGILATAAALFAGIAFDGARILRLSAH